MLEKLSDQWQTPRWLFDKLDREFHFEFDVCATAENTLCNDFIENALAPSWDTTTRAGMPLGGRLFMNPPYSNSAPFIKRAWEEAERNTIVCLLKVDPSTKWWSIFWDYKTHNPKAGCQVRFLEKRVRFEAPKASVLEKYLEEGSEKDKKLAKSLLADKITTPAFPSAVVVFNSRFYI